MRDGTIKSLIVNNMQKIYNLCHQENTVAMRQMIETKVKIDTVIEIAVTKMKLIKMLFFMVFSKKKAWEYFNKEYQINLDEMRAAAHKLLEAQKKQKEAECSDSEKKEETPKEDSPKEILLPSKQILGADGKPIQNK